MLFWSTTIALEGRGINWVHARREEHVIDTGNTRQFDNPSKGLEGESDGCWTLKRIAGCGCIIEESNSPLEAPVLLVLKRDAILWFYVDYRRLNVVTVGDVYPLPRND
jgi:hypothetical protein